LYCCGYLMCIVVFHLGRSCTLSVLICTVVVLYCFVMCVCVCVWCVCGFCNVCVCVGFVMCGCLDNMYCTLTEVLINLTEVSLTLTVVFPCFFLSCKANARAKTRKDGTRPALFHIICYLGCSVIICVVLCIVCV
jgi:hypothetical protein